ncbi:SPOR domain-containing protein [Salinisphaera hydrothermalis]|uniref:SPOR domain-containing protein n=1 Tax=Salinisphaera hydrothermalis TaxID=563188 RepID=UPI00333EF6B7
MNDVMKKRLIGVAILVVIGVLAPLLLSRCMHGGSQDNGRGSMRVYDVQPDGKAEPASQNDQENAQEGQSENGGARSQASTSGAGSSSGDANQQSANPDAVSPQSSSQFSTPPVHGNAGGASDSSNATPAASASAPPKAKSSPSSAPAARASSSEKQTAPSQSSSHDYGASSMSRASQDNAKASNTQKSSASGLEKSSIQGWVVQVASFSERGNAEDLAKNLKGQFPASYTPGQVNGKTWYRVNIGPFDSKQAAQSAADRLAKAGHKGLVRQLP